jgi:hypothetical protein
VRGSSVRADEERHQQRGDAGDAEQDGERRGSRVHARYFAPGRIATARSGAPLPPAIFIGSAISVAPVGGSRSSAARFSKAGISAANRI